jgi:hypothetical protein
MDDIRVVEATFGKDEESSSVLEGIIRLQRANHAAGGLSPEEASRHGHVTCLHTIELLKGLSRGLPQIVALAADTDEVVGYSLSVLPSIRDRTDSGGGEVQEALVQLYAPFLDMVEENTFAEKPLKTTPWALGGQVCVAKAFRRRGLMNMIYDVQGKMLASRGFEALVTVVDLENSASLLAHLKAGFEELSRGYEGQRDSAAPDATCSAASWSVVLKPLAPP